MADHVLPKSLGRAGWPAEIDPVLVVEPGTGETIAFEVSDEAYAQMDEFRDLTKLTAVLNPVTGPVHIVGAEPGDTLAVHIHDIQLADTGWSIYLPGAGALAGPMGSEWFVRKIPVANGVAQLTDKISVPIAPMIGCIGVSSATTEMSSVMPSYPSGGNLDLTDARPGSTVYLPVEVEGARLGIGDLHAVMARGSRPSSRLKSLEQRSSVLTCSKENTFAPPEWTLGRRSSALAWVIRYRRPSSVPMRIYSGI